MAELVSLALSSASSLEKDVAEIGAMNLTMAFGASLILGRLVVRRPDRPLSRNRMALQAQHVHQAYLQKTRIGGTVRRMATGTALRFHRYVLVHERPLLVDVALVANRVSIGQNMGLAQAGRAVRIVAVIALHQSLVDAVVIGLSKIRLGGEVAAITELRLLLRQQVLAFGGVMRRVAVEAAHRSAGVGRSRVVRLSPAIAVATEAAAVGFLFRNILEGENLGLIATAGDVFRPRTMAALATPGGMIPRSDQRGLPVRRLFP